MDVRDVRNFVEVYMGEKSEKSKIKNIQIVCKHYPDAMAPKVSATKRKATVGDKTKPPNKKKKTKTANGNTSKKVAATEKKRGLEAIEDINAEEKKQMTKHKIELMMR